MKSQINEKKKAGKKLMKPNTVSLEKKIKWINLWQDWQWWWEKEEECVYTREHITNIRNKGDNTTDPTDN